MTKPTTIPEDCADWSRPLPHPDTGYIIKSTSPTAAPALVAGHCVGLRRDGLGVGCDSWQLLTNGQA